MKKFILSLSVFGAILLANTEAAMAQTTTTTTTQDGKWKRMDNGTWKAKQDGTEYSYRTDKNGSVSWTSDSKKWSVMADNRWAGYDGKWYRIHDNDLIWSTDGKTWTPTDHRTWRAADGTWYMFDNNWGLWSGGNGTLPPAHSEMK